MEGVVEAGAEAAATAARAAGKAQCPHCYRWLLWREPAERQSCSCTCLIFEDVDESSAGERSARRLHWASHLASAEIQPGIRTKSRASTILWRGGATRGLLCRRPLASPVRRKSKSSPHPTVPSFLFPQITSRNPNAGGESKYAQSCICDSRSGG